jgi:hypothetical protein
MSYLGTKENAKSDIQSVEPYNKPMEASSPGLMGGSSPGPSNKLSGEVMEQRKRKDRSVDNKNRANQGDSVTRKME